MQGKERFTKIAKTDSSGREDVGQGEMLTKGAGNGKQEQGMANRTLCE